VVKKPIHNEGIKAMDDQQLAEHMELFHWEYSDDGRVVSIDAYRALVHDADHSGNEGITVPHIHGNERNKANALPMYRSRQRRLG